MSILSGSTLMLRAQCRDLGCVVETSEDQLVIRGPEFAHGRLVHGFGGAFGTLRLDVEGTELRPVVTRGPGNGRREQQRLKYDVFQIHKDKGLLLVGRIPPRVSWRGCRDLSGSPRWLA